MTFFNWSPNPDGTGPAVSRYIWIYFFITGAFTLLTLTLFWYFVSHRQKKSRSRARDDDSLV